MQIQYYDKYNNEFIYRLQTIFIILFNNLIIETSNIQFN